MSHEGSIIPIIINDNITITVHPQGNFFRPATMILQIKQTNLILNLRSISQLKYRSCAIFNHLIDLFHLKHPVFQKNGILQNTGAPVFPLYDICKKRRLFGKLNSQLRNNRGGHHQDTSLVITREKRLIIGVKRLLRFKNSEETHCLLILFRISELFILLVHKR